MTHHSNAHSARHRAMASATAALMLTGTVAPAALGAAASAKQPACGVGQKAAAQKKRVRVTKKVKVHGKMKKKRVWVTKTVWVCAPLPKPAGDTVAPSAPTGVAAAAGNGQVQIVWSPATDNVGVVGYRVSRDGALVGSPTATEYLDTGLVNGQAYTYTVAAVDAAGNTSAVASVVATPKSNRDTAAPAPPPNFAAVAGDGQVALSWDAASDNVGVVFYELQRDGITIATQEGRTFTDLLLVNGTTYNYTVVAVDGSGNVSAASSVSATPADTIAPSVPTGLTATPGDSQVSLSWTPSTDNAAVTGYRVYRGGVLVASPSTPYYADTSVTNGVSYSYTVVAVDSSANASGASAPASATPVAPDLSDHVAPTAPTNVIGTAGTGQASLSWTASTDNIGVTGYRVYRGGQLVGSPAGPSFVDTGLTNGVQYSYTVKAIDAAGNLSTASSTVLVTPADTQAPSVPTGLHLTKNAAQHSITVAWTASTDNVGVVRYRLYRNGTLVSQPTAITYNDLDLANGHTYSYTVAAVDAAGNVSAQAPAVSTYVS